jgi:hypothetical protein
MAFQPGRDRRFFYFKAMGLLICLLLAALGLSCTASSGSTSGSGSSTGTGWAITVSATPSSASASRGEYLSIVVLVKDRNGTPAIKGTNVCVSALRGGFINPSSTDPAGLVVNPVCSATTNDIGQVQVTYNALRVYNVERPAGSGTYTSVNGAIDPGPDTITGTAMGASGSTSVQVTP